MYKVVKIRIKSLLLSLVILLVFSTAAHAAGSKLHITDLDVKVGARTSFNLANGDSISQAAKPGDPLEFRVKVNNNFTFADNMDIKDITVKVTVEGIDDNSDIDQESGVFNLRPNGDKTLTLKLNVPLEVEETTFNAVVDATGEDENGTTHEAQSTVRLNVNKEGHQLAITKNILSNSEVSCNRKDIRLSTTVINIGNQDEDDATLEISNPNLGLDLKDDIGRLLAQPNEDSSRVSKTYTFNVPATAQASVYPISLKVMFDNGRKTAENSVMLTVNDCAAQTQAAPKAEMPKSTDGVELVIPTTPSQQPETPQSTTITQEGILSNNAFVVGLIIAEVAAILVGVLLIFSLFRKKR